MSNENFDNRLLRIAQRKAALIGIFHKMAEKDVNNLTDVYESQNVTPMPYPPAEVSQIGMLDGIYPQEDLSGKPLGSLYYGQMEEHLAEDGETEEPEDSKEKLNKPSKPSTTNKTAYKR